MTLSLLFSVAFAVLIVFAAAKLGRRPRGALPLSAAQQTDFERRWHAIERHFASTPKPTLFAARVLLSQLLQARGLLPEGSEQERDARRLGRPGAMGARYRELIALEPATLASNAGMDALREVFMQCRTAFEELLGRDLQEPPPRPGAALNFAQSSCMIHGDFAERV